MSILRRQALTASRWLREVTFSWPPRLLPGQRICSAQIRNIELPRGHNISSHYDVLFLTVQGSDGPVLSRLQYMLYADL